MARPLVLGTRGSMLALAQSGQVARAVEAASGLAVELRVIRTRGDAVQDRPLAEIGGKGLFTAELEAGLLDGSIDFAVHSLKDLPTDEVPGLRLACFPERVDPRDVLVGPELSSLRLGAVVGTGSLRRRVQLAALRPDLVFEDIRGNIDTRLRKLEAGQYDAIVLAAAALARLGLSVPSRPLEPEQCLPAPAQGILGVQCRAGDGRVLDALGRLDHPPTRAAALAERAFLSALSGGCSVPAGALATLRGQTLELEAMFAREGAPRRVRVSGAVAEAAQLGQQAAEALRYSAGQTEAHTAGGV